MANRKPDKSSEKEEPKIDGAPVDEDFIQKTVEFWSKKYGRPISREDARQIIENVAGYFNTLNEWDK